MFSSLKNSFIPALVISFIACFTLIAGLSWQYHQLADRTQQEEIETIEQTMERIAAKDVLNKFMDARLDKQEEQAKIYFTENVMEQYLQNEFVLIDGFKSFEILDTEKLEDTKFRFSVEIQENDGVNDIIEIITIIKISDQYYINSINLAG
jgi:hypothetical protein